MTHIVKLRPQYLAALAIVVFAFSSGSNAALTLTISDSGALGNPSITLTNGTQTGQGPAISNGSYQLNGQASTFYTFTIDGSLMTVKTNLQGNASESFRSTSTTSLSFTAASFGDYNINNLSVSQNQGNQGSSLTDSLTSLTGKKTGRTGSYNDTLTISASSSFTQPINPVALESSLSLSSFSSPSATVGFSSMIIGSTQTPTVMLSSSTSSSSMAYLGQGLGNPYSVSNTITVKKLAVQENFGLLSGSDLIPSPEPAGIGMAMTLLPPVFLYYRRSRARA